MNVTPFRRVACDALELDLGQLQKPSPRPSPQPSPGVPGEGAALLPRRTACDALELDLGQLQKPSPQPSPGVPGEGVALVPRRGGFTIIELLVVIGIMLAVTAMAIPLLAPSREDRRVTEASRIVSSMFAGARARAIEIGRPVGVTLERDPANPLRCLSLSYAEVPPPYAGGLVNSRIIIETEPDDDNDGDGAIDADDFLDYNGDGIRNPYGLVTAIANDPAPSAADPTWLGLIRRGDTLKLNYQGHEFTLQPSSSAGVDANGFFTALDGGTNAWVLGSAIADSAPAKAWYEDSMSQDNRYTHNGTDYGGYPFQIRRSPYRSAGQTQTLPETMCVDLDASNTSADAIPFGAADDITILYNPGGSIDSIRWSSGATVVPSGPLFLLIGKTALVGGNVAPKPNEPVYNWQDLDARWLMINHQSGLLASNPTTTVDDSAAVNVQITQSRAIAREGIKIGDK